MLSTWLTTLNYPVILSHRCSTTVSLETYPLLSVGQFVNQSVNQTVSKSRELLACQPVNLPISQPAKKQTSQPAARQQAIQSVKQSRNQLPTSHPVRLSVGQSVRSYSQSVTQLPSGKSAAMKFSCLFVSHWVCLSHQPVSLSNGLASQKKTKPSIIHNVN